MLHDLAIENENRFGFYAAQFCVHNCPVMTECMRDFHDLPFGVIAGKGALERIGPAHRGTNVPPVKNRPPLNPTSKDIRDMTQMYYDGMSTGDIAPKYGTSPEVIRNHLRKHGVKFRTRSEAQKLRTDRKQRGERGRFKSA